jgi:chorismate mutase
MRSAGKMNRAFARLFVLLSAAFLASGCRFSAPPNPQSQADIDHLLDAMERRLALMHDVARCKWNAGQPVLDAQRERELLEKVVERGQAKGIDPDLVRRFFAAQMEAARSIQQADFDRWSAEKQQPFVEATSLGELRTQIDRLNVQVIDALGAISDRLADPATQSLLQRRAQVILSGEHVAPVRAKVIKPLIR